ncbi:type II secretion system protein J [Patescibacteria group bacterium]
MTKIKKTNRKNGQTGFTLIEVLIYGAIFSLFLLLITQLFITIKTSAANSMAMTNLQQNFIRIFSDMNQSIRKAEGVVSPTSGNSAADLSLNGGTLLYQVNDGVLEKVDGGTTFSLSDNGVSITALSFENVGEATQTASVKIQMTVDSNYLFEGGRTISENFKTTISLR